MKISKKIIMCICVLTFSLIFVQESVYAAGVPITIDGYYDDWEDKPSTIFTWRSWNGTSNHDVSMIKDEEYIYIYVKMHETYERPIPVDAIYLSVNSQTCQMFVRYVSVQNTTDWNRNMDLSKDGIYLDLHPFTYDPNNSLGDAALTVSSGEPNDRMEFRVNIKELEKVMGLREGTVNSGSKITLRMPNVGAEEVVLMGTSSGPVLGLILCVAVVVFVLWRRNKKVGTAV